MGEECGSSSVTSRPSDLVLNFLTPGLCFPPVKLGGQSRSVCSLSWTSQAPRGQQPGLCCPGLCPQHPQVAGAQYVPRRSPPRQLLPPHSPLLALVIKGQTKVRGGLVSNQAGQHSFLSRPFHVPSGRQTDSDVVQLELHVAHSLPVCPVLSIWTCPRGCDGLLRTMGKYGREPLG